MHATISHRLPGRLRLEIDGMQHRQMIAYKLALHLSKMEGVTQAICNSDTGRALIRFDEQVLSIQSLLDAVNRWCAKETGRTDDEWAAAAKEQAAPKEQTVTKGQVVTNPYLWPTIASGSLLALLSVKRLLFGRAAFATAPVPFYAAAGLSILAGYPSLRRGVEGSIRERRLNSDLWLGLATLSLAAIRENLVALSAITILNLALFQRHVVVSPLEATHLTPEVERYSRKLERAGTWLAPITFLLTRSPLRALGMLLAVNPRPALLMHKYTWVQAEKEAERRGHRLPLTGNLETLAAVRSIVLTDTTSLVQDGQGWEVRVMHEGLDEGKAIAAAASLLQKEEHHPWRDALLWTAEQEHRTLRTPFHVETKDEGVSGIINGHQTLFGPKRFIRQFGVDLTAALLEERRMRREGYKPYILVQDGNVLALIGRKQRLASDWQKQIATWENQGYSVFALQRDERIPCSLPLKTVAEVRRNLANGMPVAVVGELDLQMESPHLVHVQKTSELSGLMQFCLEVRQRIEQDLRIAKGWSMAGAGMALLTPAAAPVINLLGDAVGVLLLSRRNRRQVAATIPLARQQKQAERTPYHAMSGIEVLAQFQSNPQGLTQEDVWTIRKRFGPNVLQSAPPPNPVQVFLGQFKDLSTLILLAASGLSIVMREPFNALIMSGILVVNAIIGTWQELKSNHVIQAMKEEDHAVTKAMRSGTEQLVQIHELVPGDIVILEAGDRVPADIRILEANQLEANEAMLTGESLPVSKHADPIDATIPMADRKNLLYMGTLLTRGRARGIVIATGNNTEIGSIQNLLDTGREAPTPLQIRVSQISKRFVTGAFVAGGLVVAAGLLRGIPPIELLISSITMAASAIPEGLPLTITIALTAGVLRMAKQKTVVRKLGSLESLGRVTVICSDKTGTLTRNEMTVKEITTINQALSVTGDVDLNTDVRQLIQIGLLCNNASLEETGDRQKIVGDPTEAALLALGNKAGLHVKHWIRQREIPFDSDTGSMSVLCQSNPEAANIHMFSKGSPEAILQKCTHYQQNGEILILTDSIRQQITAQNLRLAKRALRVLAFAYRLLDEDEVIANAKEERLVFVGLVGMMDPPKQDAMASIEEARRLGVKPVMITGDHPLTAIAIGQQLGIYREEDRVLTGADLMRLTPEELSELVRDTTIFARVSPEHKLRIVEAYQKNGEIVAMTGDGVNDAPAIRKADVGIAMGAKGTDVTKDTAGIVLLEDGFHSIVEGIKEGRSIIGNIRKAIGALLTGNLAEILVGATAVVVGLPMPLIPLQILLMNLLTDGLPAIVLATNPKRTGSKQTDVVDSSLYKTIVTRGTVLGLGALLAFAGSLAAGVGLPAAQTMAFATLVAGQLIQTVAWRNHETEQPIPLREDRPLLLAMGVSWFALLVSMYMPGLQTIFATQPLGFVQWAVVLAVAGSVTAISSILLKRPGSLQKPNLLKHPIQLKPFEWGVSAQ